MVLWNIIQAPKMKFKFKIQQYQTEAVENTVAVFTGQPSHTMAQYRIDRGKKQQQQQITYEGDDTGYRNHRIELTTKRCFKTSTPYRTVMILLPRLHLPREWEP